MCLDRVTSFFKPPHSYETENLLDYLTSIFLIDYTYSPDNPERETCFNILNDYKLDAKRFLDYFCLHHDVESKRQELYSMWDDVLYYYLNNDQEKLDAARGIATNFKSSPYLNSYNPTLGFEKTYLTVLIHAIAETGSVKIFEKLTQKHTDLVNFDFGKSGYSPLHTAILKNEDAFIKKLVANGANINKERCTDAVYIVNGHNEHMPTPLVYALSILFENKHHYLQAKQIKTVEVLLKLGANPDVEGYQGSARQYCKLHYDRAQPAVQDVFDSVLTMPKNMHRFRIG